MTESKTYNITKSIKILFLGFVLIFIVPSFLSLLTFKIALPNDPSSISEIIKFNFGLLPDFFVFLVTGVPSLFGVRSHGVFIDVVITLAIDIVIGLAFYHVARKQLRTNIFDSLTIAVSTTICFVETAFMLMIVGIMILAQGL